MPRQMAQTILKNNRDVPNNQNQQTLNVPGTSINSHLIENSYGRAALSAFVRLQ
jgi:hypothetical protein